MKQLPAGSRNEDSGMSVQTTPGPESFGQPARLLLGSSLHRRRNREMRRQSSAKLTARNPGQRKRVELFVPLRKLTVSEPLRLSTHIYDFTRFPGSPLLTRDLRPGIKSAIRSKRI